MKNPRYFIQAPLMYSKLALLFKPRLLYPSPVDVIKVSMFQSKLEILSKLCFAFPNLADVLKARCFI